MHDCDRWDHDNPPDDYTEVNTKQLQTFPAPGHATDFVLRLPSVHAEAFPAVDDHLVEAETREEMVRGVRMIAQPAHPPHADRHIDLGHVIRAHVKPGYIVSADLLTRFGPKSDFATDVCVRKEGDDPQTGRRHLEELAFEIVNEQSLRHITIRAEDIIGRGVRRLIVLFVKRGTVTEWSQAEHRFVELPLDGVLEDPTLVGPIPIRALLDAVAAEEAVALAMWERDLPVIAERKQELRARAYEEVREHFLRVLLLTLEGRGLHPSADQRAAIEACTDDEQLARWLLVAARVSSVAELLEA